MTHDKDLKILQQEVEKKLGWRKAAGWHSSMFNELSELVFEGTGVMLSVATLKRFFGVVNHSGVPSITTLDALSMFVGKENWRAFKVSKPGSNMAVRPPRKAMYVTLGFILAIVTISLIGNRRPDLVINASEFSFSSKVLGKAFPNSVVFDFSIPQDIVADSFKIQQYWDPSKTISIQADQSQATGIYYYPGYFEAKLLVDGQVARTHDLFLKSYGWLGQIEYAGTPKYFGPIVQERSIRAPAAIHQEIAEQTDPVVTSFHYIDDLGAVSGDHFQLSATIKNTFDDRWAVCHSLKVYVLATDGAFVIPFSKIGCSSDNNLMLNDTYLNGKTNDLSALSADFSEETQLQIKVEHKQVTFLINEQTVYQSAYEDTMGDVVGLRFKFKGLGEVLDYTLRDQDGVRVSI